MILDAIPQSRIAPRRRLYLGLAVVLSAFAACRPGLAASGDVAPPRPPVQEYARVIFGTDTVVAEIASTPRAHEMGLMFRDSVPDGTGMLFVFDEAEVRGFWMDNTHVDLDVAFLDPSFRVIDIQQLEAMDREVKDSRVPFMYAVEVPKGWLEAHGVEIGDVVTIEGLDEGGG